MSGGDDVVGVGATPHGGTGAADVHALDVVLHPVAGRLDVLWSDGRLAQLPAAALRAACRCAACESRRRAGEPPAVAAGTALTALHPVGAMGLQLVFSDGHDRGIYPWAYLHELSSPETAA